MKIRNPKLEIRNKFESQISDCKSQRLRPYYPQIAGLTCTIQ
jgi:hypothetical protein